MITVNMLEAKTNLSRYVASVENGTEPFVIISRGGKPVAKIVPYRCETAGRIGLAEGAIPYLSSLEEFNSIPCEDDFSGNGGLL
jgi:prevent-host-death family protein